MGPYQFSKLSPLQKIEWWSGRVFWWRRVEPEFYDSILYFENPVGYLPLNYAPGARVCWMPLGSWRFIINKHLCDQLIG